MQNSEYLRHTQEGLQKHGGLWFNDETFVGHKTQELKMEKGAKAPEIKVGAALVCGSMAYDTIMVFQDKFKNHILPDKVHMLNVSFLGAAECGASSAAVRATSPTT